jgi:hypothetical protein
MQAHMIFHFTSLADSKASGRLLVLISAGILLHGKSSLAAEPVFDLQEQARQFIMPEPNFNGPQVGWVAPRRRR